MNPLCSLENSPEEMQSRQKNEGLQQTELKAQGRLQLSP
jgi:hypothetical protein